MRLFKNKDYSLAKYAAVTVGIALYEVLTIVACVEAQKAIDHNADKASNAGKSAWCAIFSLSNILLFATCYKCTRDKGQSTPQITPLLDA